MLIKYKLGDVAKDFGKQNKELIGILSRYFEAVSYTHLDVYKRQLPVGCRSRR